MTDLQEKLNQNVGRNRKLACIFIHDLDTLKGPFVYEALTPDAISFNPVNREEEFTASELMVEYAKDKHLRHYLPIIKGSELYPVIKDSNGVVLSLPPIITGQHPMVTLKTKNVLIECTGTELTTARVVLDTMVCMFSQYCTMPFTVEKCEIEVENKNGEVTKTKFPDLEVRQLKVNVNQINRGIGINLSGETMADLLTKMCLSASVENDENLVVRIPPTRHDIIQACDVYGSIAVAHGYDTLAQSVAESTEFSLTSYTVGSQTPLNKLTEKLREEVRAETFTETLTFALCSKEDIGEKLRKPLPISAVTIDNPKSSEFQVVRTTLLPGLLKTPASNREMRLPLKLFEISEVVLKEVKDEEVLTRNERRLCAVYYDKLPGFELLQLLHGVLDRVMQMVEIPRTPEGGNNGYYLEETEDSTYCSRRAFQVICKGKPIGFLGVLHPEVLENFGLNMPCATLEINIEPFL